MVTDVLQKMIKQRRELIDMYKKGGREELADAEAAEIAVIEDFLPAQMSDAGDGAAIDAIVAEIGAATIKDMGKVMAVLKERHAGQIDMAQGQRGGGKGGEGGGEGGGGGGLRGFRRSGRAMRLVSRTRGRLRDPLPCLPRRIACAHPPLRR